MDKIKTLIKSVVLNEFYDFLLEEKIQEKNIDIIEDKVIDKFYFINKDYLDLDFREKRSIQILSPSSKIKRNLYMRLKYDQKLILDEKLNSIKNIGFDLITRSTRNITKDEEIITLLENGNTIKNQLIYEDMKFIHLIIPKNYVLKFKSTRNKISFISKDEAEELDDLKPNKYTFIDSSSIKRKYKFIYSKKINNKLFKRLKKDGGCVKI